MVGMSSARVEVGLDDPCRSLPTHPVLSFFDSGINILENTTSLSEINTSYWSHFCKSQSVFGSFCCFILVEPLYKYKFPSSAWNAEKSGRARWGRNLDKRCHSYALVRAGWAPQNQPLLKGWKYVLFMNNKALISLLQLSSLARVLNKWKHQLSKRALLCKPWLCGFNVWNICLKNICTGSRPNKDHTRVISAVEWGKLYESHCSPP